MFRSEDHPQGAKLFLAKVTFLKTFSDFKCFNVKKLCICVSWCAD